MEDRVKDPSSVLVKKEPTAIAVVGEVAAPTIHDLKEKFIALACECVCLCKESFH